MTGYALHPESYTDIQEIAEYIADDSLNASTRVVNRIFDAIEDLVSMPYQGHSRSGLTSRPLRSWRGYYYLIA